MAPVSIVTLIVVPSKRASKPLPGQPKRAPSGVSCVLPSQRSAGSVLGGAPALPPPEVPAAASPPSPASPPLPAPPPAGVVPPLPAVAPGFEDGSGEPQ